MLRYPRHKDEQMKLLNMITEYVKAAPGTVALNERAYDRYKRYTSISIRRLQARFHQWGADLQVDQGWRAPTRRVQIS